jgi:hypothetical protein
MRFAYLLPASMSKQYLGEWYGFSVPQFELTKRANGYQNALLRTLVGHGEGRCYEFGVNYMLERRGKPYVFSR